MTNKIYETINLDDILAAPDNDVSDFPWCICKEDVGGATIFCDNSKCPKGEWFHLDCLELNEEVRYTIIGIKSYM